MIGLVAVTAAGRRACAELAAAWPGETTTYEGPAAVALPAAFAECAQIVSFTATGVAVRLLAPLLVAKGDDPGVVCVDEARRFAVALLGGHAGGANALAGRVSAVLGGQAVVTTASDSTGLPGLDQLGWPVEGEVAAVARAILDGEPVTLESDWSLNWPLPALPANVGSPPRSTPEPGEPAYRLIISDREPPGAETAETAVSAVLRPPSLVIGVGASRGVTAAEVLALFDAVLSTAGLSARSVRHLATIDVKAAEPGIVAAASLRGWRLVTYPAARLAAIEVPTPSDRVLAEVGTASVAEAAALAEGGRLLVPKTTSAAVLPDTGLSMATAAVVRLAPRGRLTVIGLGPGARDLMTPRAREELRGASVVVGLDQYVDQIRDVLRPGTTVLVSGLGEEEKRARTAVAQAQSGLSVALIGSGDAGVYAMASPALEAADAGIDVVGVPGITAAVAAAAVLGAPLGHDHAYISLSDLHTPWPVIQRRLRAAAEGDFVVCFYNPRSRARWWQLGAALDLLAAQRPDDTPVGLVREASRSEQTAVLTTLQQLRESSAAGEAPYADVDMYTVVLVGSSQTRLVAGRMVTPRGYRWQP